MRKALKVLLWSTATAYVKEFIYYMEKIEEENPEAYLYHHEIGPDLWSRSHFSSTSTCDLLCNNISESFNKFIKEAWVKPVVTMLEMIRKMMKRIQEKKGDMLKHRVKLCRKIRAKLGKNVEDSLHISSIYAGNDQWEVTYKQDTVVDLRKKMCV